MALDEDLVSTGWVILTTEEVVETNFVKRSRRGKGRDVTAHTNSGALGSVNQHGGVPAHPRAVGALD